MKKRKTFLAFLIVLVLGSATCLGATAAGLSEASTGETFISFNCDGNEKYLNKTESSAIGESGILVYTEGGSNGAVKTTELYAAAAHGVYEFDLADNVTEAYFNFVGGAFTAAHKADGEADYTNFSITHGSDQFQIYTFKLTASDALKNVNRKFKIKLTNGTAGQINLYMLSVVAKEHKLVDGVTLTNNTVSVGLPYMISSGGSFTYWDGAADKGFIHGNGQAADIIYRFNFDSQAVKKIKLESPTLDGGVNAGWKYSADGVTYSSYVAGTEIDTSQTPTIFIKVSTEEGYRLLVKGITVQKIIEAGTDLSEIDFRTDGSDAETAFINDVQGQQIYETQDGNIGLGSVKTKIRLFDVNGYITYQFDLANSISEAYFNVVGGDFKVEYSTDNQTYTALSPSTLDANSMYFIRSYKLTTSNALANSTKSFRIRLTNTAAGQICLFRAGVFNSAQAGEAVNYVNDTISTGLKNVVGASGNVIIYHDNEKIDKGFAFLKAGSKIEYKFNINKTDMPKPQLALGISGGTLAWEYSTDGITYAAGSSDKTAQFNGISALHIRVENTGSADMLLRDISLKNNDIVAAGDNSNTNIPANEKESYIFVGSAAEANYVFGTGANAMDSFNAAHSGLTRDGHEGGWADSQPMNARKLLAGEYLAYDFDMPNDVTSAKLKIHASTGIRVKVSSDKCQTMHVLTPQGAAGGRGMYIFDLAEANALANADNTFRVVIEGIGESYVNAVLVHENAEAVADRGVTLSMWSKEGLRYLEETNKVHSYFSHSMYPAYFFKEADSYAVFKVKFSDLVSDPVFYINQCGDIKVELSGDGESYTEVMKNLLGGAGEVPYNAINVKSYLGENKTVWIKLSNTNGGAFVLDMGIASAEKDTASGKIDMSNFQNGLYQISESNKIGSMLKINSDGKKAVKIGGETVLRIDLSDSAHAAKFTVNGLGGSGELLISSDGQNYEVIGSLKQGATTVTNYSAFKNNDKNVIYLKFKSGDFVFSGMEYTTENIPLEGDKEKPYEDDDVSFNYGGNLPGIDSYGKPAIGGKDNGTAKIVFNRALVVGLSVGGGCLVLLGGAFACVWFFVIKKKGGAK